MNPVACLRAEAVVLLLAAWVHQAFGLLDAACRLAWQAARLWLAARLATHLNP